MAKGDHIRVRRYRGIYSHHGIDIGDGTVVHFAGEPLQIAKAQVVRDTMENFLEGGECKIVRYENESRTPDEVVALALEQVGIKGYRLWTNNCEHFASYCKTGEKKSSQVQRALRASAGVATTVVVTGGALFITVVALKVRGGAQRI